MKYLITIILAIIGLLIIGCEPETATYYYDYLTMINCDGSNKIQLAEFRSCNTIFYNNDQQLILIEPIGGAREEITLLDLSTLQLETIFPVDSLEWDINNLEFFPNDNKLIFSQTGHINGDMYLVSMESGNVENLTNTNSIVEGKVKASPNYEYFAYIEKNYNTYPDSVFWSLKYRNIDGSINLNVISEFSTENAYSSVDWINENTLIYVNGKYFSEPGIYTVNVDGSNNQFIYEGFLLHLSLCEDGTKVVFEDDDEIYLLNTTNYSISHLVAGNGPLISPDGNKLAYLNEYSELIVWDMETDQKILLSDFPATSASSFSSDNQKLIFNETIVVTYTSGGRNILE